MTPKVLAPRLATPNCHPLRTEGSPPAPQTPKRLYFPSSAGKKQNRGRWGIDDYWIPYQVRQRLLFISYKSSNISLNVLIWPIRDLVTYTSHSKWEGNQDSKLQLSYLTEMGHLFLPSVGTLNSCSHKPLHTVRSFWILLPILYIMKLVGLLQKIADSKLHGKMTCRLTHNTVIISCHVCNELWFTKSLFISSIGL